MYDTFQRTQVVKIKTHVKRAHHLERHVCGEVRPSTAEAVTGGVDVLVDNRAATKALLRDIERSRRGRPACEIVDFMIAGPPTFAGQLEAGWSRRRINDAARAWAEDTLDFIRRVGGGNTHIVCAALHMDEASPHLHCMIVPRAPDNTLSWRKCGESQCGSRFYRKIQNDYQREVGRRHGLARGNIGSKGKGKKTDVDKAIEEKAAEKAEYRIGEIRGHYQELDRQREQEHAERRRSLDAEEQALRKDGENLDDQYRRFQQELDDGAGRLEVARLELKKFQCSLIERARSLIERVRRIPQRLKGSSPALKQASAPPLSTSNRTGFQRPASTSRSDSASCGQPSRNSRGTRRSSSPDPVSSTPEQEPPRQHPPSEVPAAPRKAAGDDARSSADRPQKPCAGDSGGSDGVSDAGRKRKRARGPRKRDLSPEERAKHEERRRVAREKRERERQERKRGDDDGLAR